MLSGTRYRAIAAKGDWNSHFSPGRPAPSLIIANFGEAVDASAMTTTVESMAERCKLVLLADRCDAELCRLALCAGAAAYLPRSVSADVLLRTLDLVQDGEVVFPIALARRVLACSESKPDRPRGDAQESSGSGERLLSSREVEILKRLIQGDSNKHISRQLDIAETTVKVHVKAILRKINVSNRTQAAIWGLQYLSHSGAGVAQMPTSPPVLTGQQVLAGQPTVKPSRGQKGTRLVARPRSSQPSYGLGVAATPA